MSENGKECRAATRVQKFYRSYQTRRRLADSAVVVEELWKLALETRKLNHATAFVFNCLRQEAASLKWIRVGINASRVGKGLSGDDNARKLVFQHWIEAIDPRHRYGHNLHLYFAEWCESKVGQRFFYWLDLGEGKEIDLKDCPRSKLRKECIKYLGPQERKQFEYEVVDGKIVHKPTGELLDSNKGSPGSKWIFVMSTCKRLYAGEKKKGSFHHSSFLAGGATLAAGILMAEEGVLKYISASSGHYKPTDENLDLFLSFLKEHGVNLDEVEIRKASEVCENSGREKSVLGHSISKSSPVSPDVLPDFSDNLLDKEEKDIYSETNEVSEAETKTEYKRTLSGGLLSPKVDVPKKAILERINSKKAAKSNQLGHQLSLKWSTGAGPRIGCVADYPVELRQQALEFTDLSPRDHSIVYNHGP